MGTQTLPVSPTRRFKIWGESVTVDLFGRTTGDWRTRFSVEDLGQPAAQTDRAVMRRLSAVTNPRYVHRILMPRPDTFNAVVVTTETPGWTELAPSNTNVRILRGVLADGVVLGEHEAGFINSGGCPTIIMMDKKSGTIVVGHAGRESLYDKGYIDGGGPTPGRPAESIVYSMLDTLKLAQIRNIHVFITCGISGIHFRHPLSCERYGDRNRAMIEHIRQRWGDSCLLDRPELGRISLHELIVAQCVGRGITRTNISYDSTDTFGDSYEGTGKPVWHDHRRDSVLMPNEKIGRNGVLVYRTGTT